MDRVHSSSNTPRRPLFCLYSGFLLISSLFLPQTQAFGQAPAQKVSNFLEVMSGFNLQGNIHEGALDPGQSMGIALTFIEGADYMVVAYSDDQCTNLDLALLDSSGEEIQSDRLPDAEPMLLHRAEETGGYFIQVTVVESSPDGCDFAVGILASTEEPGINPGEDMAGRLSLVGAELMGLGFVEIGEEKRGALGTEQAIKLPFTLQGGLEYRMVGVCDKDCFDLDLALIDSEGEDAASDFYDDDVPILVHQPDSTSEYQVEVIMAACGIEPCAFRIATYAKEPESTLAGATFSGTPQFWETVRGELDPRDKYLAEAFIDTYEVEAKAGQRIILDLRSEEFDTLLRLLSPDGDGEENDDYGYDTGHSHIEMLTLFDGTYSIQVTSFDANSTGAYVLQIVVVQ